MNLFASSLLLSQVSLEDFLETTPENRVRAYGGLVSVERIVSAILLPAVWAHRSTLIVHLRPDGRRTLDALQLRDGVEIRGHAAPTFITDITISRV